MENIEKVYKYEINDRVYIIFTENGQFESVHLLRDDVLYDIITERDQWAIGKTPPGPIFLFKSDFDVETFNAYDAETKIMSEILEYVIEEGLSEMPNSTQKSEEPTKRKI